ncbi:galactosyltransferase-related protein [Klenkia sp. LSe6-5]|uniref:Galactosyltransferase-related protein n=1 Tax=Klenkia sesuvii TaxID=3103137 RepID=A0ABU8DNA1_9ACTN
MRTAVVTVVHGRHDHLARQLAGLAAQTRPADDHVVVAMGDDGVAAVVGDRARVVDLPAGDRLPLAAARNAGAAAALDRGAGLLVFLDVDCIPAPVLLARYAAVAQDGVLDSGPVTYLPPAPDYDLAALPTLADPHPARPAPPDGEVWPAADHRLFWSLSFALTAATWTRLDGFCTEYAGYGGEDTDFAETAHAAGVPLRWVGGAAAFHQHHPVSRPPVEHLSDVLANGAVFARRWGWWPMQGWLEAFQERGLVRRAGEDWVAV